jgi:hypothetical protein
MAAAAEFGLLMVLVEGGDYVAEVVTDDIGEDTLFKSIVDNSELPECIDGEGYAVTLNSVAHELLLFPTEDARDTAYGALIEALDWMSYAVSRRSVHLHELTAAELATYRDERSREDRI